jgi:hypothetical protein
MIQNFCVNLNCFFKCMKRKTLGDQQQSIQGKIKRDINMKQYA